MTFGLARKEYEHFYLGNWVAQCAVEDFKGQHCPDEPVHYLDHNGVRIGLCERCYLNYREGAYRRDRAKMFNREDRLYIRTTAAA